MEDSGVANSNGEDTQFKITVACEFYGDQELIQDALIQLPDFNGKLVWGPPRMPDPLKLMDAEWVLIVTDHANLLAAMGRSLIYKQLGRGHILIYLQSEAEGQAEAIPALTLAPSELATGLFNLTQVLIEPSIMQGLVGIDWADTRTILAMGGQVVLVSASADQPEKAIKNAMSHLQSCASGRSINGLQVAILCHEGRLATRHAGDLLRACKDVTGEDTTLIVAAPLLDWPDIDSYEVRLFAKIECAGQSDTTRLGF